MKRIRRRRVYVKPVMKDCEMMGWVVLELGRWESFVDDWRRYGGRVALLNLLIDWGMSIG